MPQQAEKHDALARGKATAAVIGTRAMGTRFNVLMTIQIPLQQKRKLNRRLEEYGGWMEDDYCGGMGGRVGGGAERGGSA